MSPFTSTEKTRKPAIAPTCVKREHKFQAMKIQMFAFRR